MRPLQGSFIPTESKPLAGLKEVKRRTISAYVEAVHPGWDVTLDVDDQLIETNKADAQYCYEDYKTFQSAEVSWAETMLVLVDEFREGDVPASRDIARLVDEAYETLPPGPWRVKVRSDSVGSQQECLDCWQERGWQFAVSADMSRQLRKEIEALPAASWQMWEIERGGVIREWAEVPYVPTRQYERRVRIPVKSAAVSLQSGWRIGDSGRGGRVERSDAEQALV